MVMLGGGNDGFNAFAPISGTDRTRYQTLRGGLAIPAAQLLPAAEGYGFHPRLAKLRARYATGPGRRRARRRPAHQRPLALHLDGHLHGRDRRRRRASSGWLGRYLDGVTEFDSGMRGITFSSSVPLHLLGQRAKVTAVPDQGGMWGSDPTERWERVRLRRRAGLRRRAHRAQRLGRPRGGQRQGRHRHGPDDQHALPARPHRHRPRPRPHARGSPRSTPTSAPG